MFVELVAYCCGFRAKIRIIRFYEETIPILYEEMILMTTNIIGREAYTMGDDRYHHSQPVGAFFATCARRAEQQKALIVDPGLCVGIPMLYKQGILRSFKK